MIFFLEEKWKKITFFANLFLMIRIYTTSYIILCHIYKLNLKGNGTDRIEK